MKETWGDKIALLKVPVQKETEVYFKKTKKPQTNNQKKKKKPNTPKL